MAPAADNSLIFWARGRAHRWSQAASSAFAPLSHQIVTSTFDGTASP